MWSAYWTSTSLITSIYIGNMYILNSSNYSLSLRFFLKTQKSRSRSEMKGKQKKNNQQLFNMSILFGISNVIYQECKRLFAHHRITNLRRFLWSACCLFFLFYPCFLTIPLSCSPHTIIVNFIGSIKTLILFI